MPVKKELLKNYITKIFSDINGFDLEGLNKEKEILSALFNTAQMINENFHTPININDIVDKTEINNTLKEMAIKCGKTSSDKNEVTFLQLYLARVYANIKRLTKIEFSDGLNENNFKDHTISASISIDLGGLIKPRLNFSKDDERLVFYSGYNTLPENLKQLFKHELRMKVLSHELSHASMCTKDYLGSLVSLEEILVERLALKAQNITRTLTKEEYNYGYSKNSPNPESSNYRIYASGEILSKIIGEEKLQTARLLGKKHLSKLLEDELKTSAVNLNTYLDSSTDKQLAHHYFNGASPEHSRILAQLEVEAFLVSTFKEKTLNNLKNTDKLKENDLYNLYKDCLDIKQVILLGENNIDQMQPVIDLRAVVSRLDEICKEKGIDYKQIKKDIKIKKLQEDTHYIKQNTIAKENTLKH